MLSHLAHRIDKGIIARTRAAARRVVPAMLLGLVLAGCATDGGGGAVRSGSAMRDGGVVMPPAGWLDYCSRHPADPSCQAAELTPLRARQLREVLAALRRLPVIDDQTRFGKADYWEAADRRGGDCEDFALAARARLIALGWALSAVRLASAWTERGDYHLVLTVDVAAAGKVATVVVDRRFPHVESWQHLRAVGYRFVARQAATGATWVEVDDGARKSPPLRYANAGAGQPPPTMALAAVTLKPLIDVGGFGLTPSSPTPSGFAMRLPDFRLDVSSATTPYGARAVTIASIYAATPPGFSGDAPAAL